MIMAQSWDLLRSSPRHQLPLRRQEHSLAQAAAVAPLAYAHEVEAVAGSDRSARVGMAEIVEAHILEAGPAPDLVPDFL